MRAIIVIAALLFSLNTSAQSRQVYYAEGGSCFEIIDESYYQYTTQGHLRMGGGYSAGELFEIKPKVYVLESMRHNVFTAMAVMDKKNDCDPSPHIRLELEQISYIKTLSIDIFQMEDDQRKRQNPDSQGVFLFHPDSVRGHSFRLVFTDVTGSDTQVYYSNYFKIYSMSPTCGTIYLDLSVDNTREIDLRNCTLRKRKSKLILRNNSRKIVFQRKKDA